MEKVNPKNILETIVRTYFYDSLGRIMNGVEEVSYMANGDIRIKLEGGQKFCLKIEEEKEV